MDIDGEFSIALLECTAILGSTAKRSAPMSRGEREFLKETYGRCRDAFAAAFECGPSSKSWKAIAMEMDRAKMNLKRDLLDMWRADDQTALANTRVNGSKLRLKGRNVMYSVTTLNETVAPQDATGGRARRENGH